MKSASSCFTFMNQNQNQNQNQNLLSWQILFFFVVLLLLLATATTSPSPTPSPHCSLLLRLRSTLAFTTHSTKLLTWTPHSPCCNFSGVTCDPTTGLVVAIDLSSETLAGPLPSSSPLFLLNSLRSLNLANNSFNSTIPEAIAALSNLVSLNLSNSGLNGTVPRAVAELRRLVVLDLTSNLASFYGEIGLTLGKNSSLGELVSDLTELEELILDGVMINETGREWGNAVARLRRLRILSMVDCGLTDGIDEVLSDLEMVTTIRLDQNELRCNVSGFLSEFRNLSVLTMSFCGLQGVFPERMFRIGTLVTLDLSANPSLKGTLPEFGKDGAIQELNLHGTGFSGMVPESIGWLRGLRIVKLSHCEFEGRIPGSIGRLGGLEYLDLQWNRFSGPVPSFELAKNLEQLILSWNQLSGSIENVRWGSLSSLVYLDLSNNSMNGSIPMSLFSIPSLQKLQLQQNRFSGQLGDSLGVVSRVIDTIDLSDNELEGRIPELLFRLGGLKTLTLSFNKFDGSLSLNLLQQLKHLSALDLSYNNLAIDASGTSSNLSSFPQLVSLKLARCRLRQLPGFLKNQSKLSNLDLSDNFISGAIPSWILEVGHALNLSHNNFVSLEGSLASAELSILDLHSNNLQGQLPKFPPQATYLDLSNNTFSSTISSLINNFTVFLSLSKNNISGSIPESLCSRSFLQVLDLSHNNLSGSVPPCFISLSQSLTFLNLRDNVLNGPVPEIFAANCTLSTLDFSENFLDGPVPRSLANCTMLEVLNLGKNRLKDTFPDWLRSLSNLRVLVLRSNQFHGNISCHQANVTWPLLQIVDIALNHFEGRLMAKCFSKWPAMISSGRGLPKATPLQFSFLLFEPIYYQNMILVTFKGLELELLKILTVFTSLDISNNNFSGVIPRELGNLDGLLVLNFSHNALSGPIPSSIGNLTELESLDLSYNKLSGEIPEGLVGLTFLSTLSLAFNRLTGRIPDGAQFATFSNSSFLGNKGLCGFPLTNPCGAPNGTAAAPSGNFNPTPETGSVIGFDWQFIFTGAGFGLGMGIIVAPLMFWKKARKWYNKEADMLVANMIQRFGIVYTGLDDKGTEKEGDKEDEDEADEPQGGRFCVFCTKLDSGMKRIIHDPMCTCHGSSTISLSSSPLSTTE
ncbi:Receptor-like protein [Drosera capensis]